MFQVSATTFGGSSTANWQVKTIDEVIALASRWKPLGDGWTPAGRPTFDHYPSSADAIRDALGAGKPFQESTRGADDEWMDDFFTATPA
jgi:hypothetical protein